MQPKIRRIKYQDIVVKNDDNTETTYRVEAICPFRKERDPATGDMRSAPCNRFCALFSINRDECGIRAMMKSFLRQF